MSILDKVQIKKCNSCGKVKETNGDVCEQCWLEGKNTKDDRIDISQKTFDKMIEDKDIQK